MDNLWSHKRTRTRQLIKATGAEFVFLSPYSPDHIPIEMVFSKVKKSLRSRACRTGQALLSAMQGVLDQVAASDTRKCFRHCGYTLEKE